MGMKEDPMRNHQLKAAYNAQMGTEDQFIVGFSIRQKPGDAICLIPHLKAVKKRLGRLPTTRSATASPVRLAGTYASTMKSIQGPTRGTARRFGCIRVIAAVRASIVRRAVPARGIEGCESIGTSIGSAAPPGEGSNLLKGYGTDPSVRWISNRYGAE